MMAGLRVGVARADITPESPIQLAGFASRRGAKGSGQPGSLHVRVLVAEARTADGPRRLCVVSADLLSWPRELIPVQRLEVSRRTGTAAEDIMFCATHNHSGPQPDLWIAPCVGAADPQFLALFHARLLDAATRAAEDLEEVSVQQARRDYELGVNRRAQVDGRIVIGINVAGPRDSTLTTVAFRRPSGSLKAALVHYTCHPVISSDDEIVGDFPGEAMRHVETATGATALYLQGCCGDINPGQWAEAGAGEAARQGVRLGDTVLDCLRGDSLELPSESSGSTWTTAELAFDSVPDLADLRMLADRDDLEGEWARCLLANPERVCSGTRLTLQRLDLATGLSLLGMNGEVCVEYGLEIRGLSDNRVLPVAYANGMTGYVPRDYQLRQGGYEATESALVYLLPGRLRGGTEQRIRTALRSLLLAR